MFVKYVLQIITHELGDQKLYKRHFNDGKKSMYPKRCIVYEACAKNIKYTQGKKTETL